MEREPSREEKGLSTKEQIVEALNKSKWSRPLCLKRWAEVFGVKDTRIVKKWFEDGVIKNRQLSDRYWIIAVEYLPFDFMLKVLAHTLPDEVRQAWRDYMDRTTATGRPRDYVKATESWPLTYDKTH